MKASTHWFYQRVSAALLFFLLPWFAFSLVGKSYVEMVAYFKMDFSQIGLFLLMLISIFHARMGIDVVLDDYVYNEKQRKAIDFLYALFVIGGGAGCLFFFQHIYFLIIYVFLSFLYFSLKGEK